ncbi:GvpL/GvpF family gas vesicle protein [Streptomyces sp. NPDC091272]|uniref:GvpL/GvpF family gas vesicle protein n=1 Tax=Streptomyces sp. NPDC091272 TaxID=3365981 RepID=UPI003813F5AF
MAQPTDLPCLYVYAITASETALPVDCPGVGDENARVRALHRDGLAAVVSPLTARPRARRRDLRAHQEVLAVLAARGPVLPMRFGVIAPDEQSVLAELGAEREARLASLERLTGKAEWNVKGVPDPDALPNLLREDAELRALRESTRRRPGYEASVRLGEAVAAGLQHRAEQAASKVLSALRPLAAESCEGREVGGGALNASFLVAHEAEADFRAAAGRLAAEQAGRIVLTVTGPLPCYSFVSSQFTGVTPVGASS